MVDRIKEKLDNLPPGEEKDKAVEQAHRELDTLKKAQGVVNPSDLPPPAPLDVDLNQGVDPNQQRDNKLPPPQHQQP